jgi:hypothetical protein
MTHPKTQSKTERPSFTGCCPRFDPAQVQEGEVQWQDKLFVAEHVTSLFHIPLNMAWKVRHATGQIHAAGAEPTSRPLFLGEEVSPFRSNIYIEATHYVPESEMMRLSGTFLVKVFEGPFRESRKWMAEMGELAASRGGRIERLFYGFTTCPKCASAYGENYIVMYAKLAD